MAKVQTLRLSVHSGAKSKLSKPVSQFSRISCNCQQIKFSYNKHKQLVELCPKTKSMYARKENTKKERIEIIKKVNIKKEKYVAKN